MEAVNSGLIYGLEFQCRALASLESDDDAVRFVVGTQGPQASNQVNIILIYSHMLELHFICNELLSFNYQAEIPNLRTDRYVFVV